MEQNPQPRPRFDPQAALEELERFGRDIQRYRAQREAVGDQFDTFVRSFKTPPEDAAPDTRVTSAAPLAPAPPAPIAPAPPAPPAPTAPLAPSAAPTTPPAPSALAPLAPEAPPAPPAPAAAPPALARASAGAKAPLVAGALLLALGGALLTVFVWNRSPEPDRPAATASDAPAAAAPAPAAEPSPAPAAAAPAPATPAAEPSGESEIVVERQVWMRVIVDGNRVVEREVPAGTRIPLKAEKTIVIRTGDAGAVRLSLRGAPAELLGREGEVVTRTFTVPPRAPAGK